MHCHVFTPSFVFVPCAINSKLGKTVFVLPSSLHCDHLRAEQCTDNRCLSVLMRTAYRTTPNWSSQTPWQTVILLRHFPSARCSTRGLHGDGDRGNPMESTGFPRVWKVPVMLRVRSSRGNKGSGTPAGMEQNCAGFPRECSFI